MEASRSRYRDDHPRLPTLGLGHSSVRFIVDKLEAEYARAVVASDNREITKYDPNLLEDDYHDSPLDSSTGRVWCCIAVNLLNSLCKCVPSVSFANFGVLAVAASFVAPKMMSYLVLYPFCRLVFGTLYPAYASYKAVRTKNLKEYVKWMMYWIVFALFTCTETFTDVFLSWFPFYYEVKIVLVLWLLSPATKGSSILYRKFVHPALCRREQEIDEYIAKAKDQGYHTVLNLGTKGVNYATTVIMQTAIKGGGGLVQQIRKSYSLSDLTECEVREERGADEADDVMTEPRVIRRAVKSGYTTRRSASESNSRSAMYFPEVDVQVRGTRSRTDEPDFSHIKSTEDISSGYSSADNSASLSRTASLSRPRPRTAITSVRRPQPAEDDEVIIEELQDDDIFDYANMPPLVNLPSPLYISHTDPPFIYQYIGEQVKIIQVLGNPSPTNTNYANNHPDRQAQKQDADNEVSQKTMLETEFEKNAVDSLVDIDSSKKEEYVSYSNITAKDEVEISIPTSEIESFLQPISTPQNEYKDDIDGNNNANINEYETIAVINTVIDEQVEAASLDASANENETTESDDEASFGTPEDSPKSKRKSPKGKYGKCKAPPPPVIDKNDKVTKVNCELVETQAKASTESLTDIVENLPSTTFKDTGPSLKSLVINPIAEKKRRHKSKSPRMVMKSGSSGIVKLLQLPSKLAFWNKTDDKSKRDNVSISSEDHSRRSSTVENSTEEFENCFDHSVRNTTSEFLDVLERDIADDTISFKDATDFESEITHDIMEKSDALQKLIEAKLESHPEYKFVSLHDDLPTTSKSTDV